MKGAVRSDREPSYAEDGYSTQSLSMLKSEEGQLNAVFACFGSAVQHGQLLEDALSNLVGRLIGLTGADPADAALDKKTTGQLLVKFKTEFVEEIDEWVPELLDRSRERRNFLIHEYFLKRKEEMGSERGRLAMLQELVNIEEGLRGAAALVNGLGVAIERAGKGDKVGETSEAIFSVHLKIERDEDRVATGGSVGGPTGAGRRHEALSGEGRSCLGNGSTGRAGTR